MSNMMSSPWPEMVGSPQPHRPRDLHCLYNRRQLEAALLRERLRSDRNNMEFSLVLVRVRAEDTRQTLRLARMLLSRARTIDEFGWFDRSCLAALLPYTGADGAKAFCEQMLKQAQQDLIPAVCRVYTYPSAWYFEEDSAEGPHRPVENVVESPEEAAAHAAGLTHPRSNNHGNGNGNGNGNGHANSHRTMLHPTVFSNENGNGHANGNGNGHSGGNGNGNGRGAQEFEPHDLMPYFLQGITDGLQPPPAGNEGVEALLIRRLPWWKRIIDIMGAAIGLVMLSPIMIIAGIAIKVSSSGPILFKQRRAGLGGQPFWIYKFRTMSVDAEKQKAALRAASEQDGPAFKLTNDPRITPVGKFLRETSLDELPQLWNVLLGDMSLVGPRPLPMEESAACDPWQRRRLDVTPGLTCIWQVKGRSRVTFDEWMRMDVNYIRRRNIWHDVKILTQTIPAVLLRRGAK